MTVREWYRAQRRALWERDQEAEWLLHTFAWNLHLHHNPTHGLPWVKVTPLLSIVVDPEALKLWARRREFERVVQEDLERAMRRLQLHAPIAGEDP